MSFCLMWSLRGEAAAHFEHKALGHHHTEGQKCQAAVSEKNRKPFIPRQARNFQAIVLAASSVARVRLCTVWSPPIALKTCIEAGQASFCEPNVLEALIVEGRGGASTNQDQARTTPSNQPPSTRRTERPKRNNGASLLQQVHSSREA